MTLVSLAPTRLGTSLFSPPVFCTPPLDPFLWLSFLVSAEFPCLVFRSSFIVDTVFDCLVLGLSPLFPFFFCVCVSVSRLTLPRTRWLVRPSAVSGRSPGHTWRMAGGPLWRCRPDPSWPWPSSPSLHHLSLDPWRQCLYGERRPHFRHHVCRGMGQGARLRRQDRGHYGMAP